MKVLLVDPQTESRDAMRRIFAEEGDQVRSVASLSEAARQLSEFLPDAVVSALDFPEDDLFGFFDEALRRDPRMALYALTASTRLDSRARSGAFASRQPPNTCSCMKSRRSETCWLAPCS